MRLEQPLRAALLAALLAAPVFATPQAPGYATNDTTTDDFNSKCVEIASTLAIEGGVVHSSDFVPAGTNFTIPVYNETCDGGNQLITADICRVALYVSTSERSGINMEAWLPSNWTGRFLSGGNGGLNGCIKYPDLAYASGLGFAAVGTNNGHNGTNGDPFYNNADVVEDFSYRALRTGVTVGKQITNEFYGKPQDKSYYLGCSTGGRQGMKIAQDFPDDFDGIVAGAPAMAFNNLSSYSGHFYPLQGPPNSSTFVPLSSWAFVHEDVMKQCDGLDGLEDGILEDTLQCNYDPSGLVCSEGSNTTACLTPEQVETVKAIYSPLRNDQGDLVYPRLTPGTEKDAGFLLEVQPMPYAADWFKYAVYNDPSWDPATLNSTDYDNSARLDPAGIQSFKGDLSGLQNRGAKLLHWHGGADPLIPNENSARYYNHVTSTMGLSPAELDDFYRYFVISGTSHCSGGTGAHAVGQELGEINSYDPKENVLMAIIDWVENGIAPESFIGTKWVNNTQALGVEYQREHCRFPRRNQYVDGKWQCVERED